MDDTAVFVIRVLSFSPIITVGLDEYADLVPLGIEGEKKREYWLEEVIIEREQVHNEKKKQQQIFGPNGLEPQPRYTLLFENLENPSVQV